MASPSGEWLEKALVDLCGRMEGGLHLDGDLIAGLVSFCELAPPPDAADYLANIIGLEAGQNIVSEYLKRRGFVDNSISVPAANGSNFQAYMKPQADEGFGIPAKKQTKPSKETNVSVSRQTNRQSDVPETEKNSKGNANIPKKKKVAKVISLAEAAKGSVVFQKGKPCSCQARRHKLVSNCLSCGKIICEQEGEGPCNFCGALVLREGSTYAGLDDLAVPLSEAEAVAEAYAKRLVEYDRNSAARTKVIDDQSDYYEIEGNSWLSAEEKQLLLKKQKEVQEAAEAQKGKVIVTFDLLGRKVIVNKDEASELKSEYRILGPEDPDSQRIKPNPTVRVQPVFVDPGPRRDQAKGRGHSKINSGLCLEISGRVQHEDRNLLHFIGHGEKAGNVLDWQGRERDDHECSTDYN